MASRQPLALGVLAGGPLGDLDAGPAGERAERGREVDPIALHHEAEDVAAQATPEAVPRLACGGHDEAGRVLPVERAQALVGGAGLAQLDGLDR